MLKTRCPAGYRARIMLWFSGKSKQSVVLNSQSFVDATEYIPPWIGGHSRLKDRYVHALPKLQSICAKAAALSGLRSNHPASPNYVAI